MQLQDARELIGKTCSVRYTDRGGREHERVSKIYDATYVPLYGGYLVIDTDDIRFDRILSVCEIGLTRDPVPVPEREYVPLAA